MTPATEQAIDWFVRLDSGEASAADTQAFQQWLSRAPAHGEAWRALQARLGGGVDPALAQLRTHSPPLVEAGRQALLTPSSTAATRRQMLRGGAAVVLLGTATGWLVNRHTPLATLAADLRTRTGERLQQRLPDGSELTLNARSAADLRFDAAQRLVALRAGALLAQVAHEADTDAGRAPRPFIVQTDAGRVQALGTRFMVRQEDDGRSFVHVLAHGVRITTRAGQSLPLQAGQSARFDARHIAPVPQLNGAPASWAEGRIDVRDAPLGEVIEALRPYTAGVIRISPDAARLRIFGVFALDQPDRLLQDLVDTQNLRVRRWGHWLTLVDLADRAA